MLALVAPPPSTEPRLTLLKIAALPIRVESAGMVLAINGGFRILINRSGKTAQLHVSAGGEVVELPTLPLVASGVARCASGVVVTGSDGEGRPVVLGLLSDGNLAWQHLVGGLQPILWPTPVCTKGPRIIWQAEPGKLDVAEIGVDGIGQPRRFAVGGPPLAITGNGDSIWAIWSADSGIFAQKIQSDFPVAVRLTSSHSSEIAACAYGQHICVVFSKDSTVVLLKVGSNGKCIPLDTFEMPQDLIGQLGLVSWLEPLVWIRGTLRKGERLLVKSIFFAPTIQALEVNGFVYSAATQDDSVAILGEEELLLLRLSTIK